MALPSMTATLYSLSWQMVRDLAIVAVGIAAVLLGELGLSGAMVLAVALAGAARATQRAVDLIAEEGLSFRSHWGGLGGGMGGWQLSRSVSLLALAVLLFIIALAAIALGRSTKPTVDPLKFVTAPSATIAPQATPPAPEPRK